MNPFRALESYTREDRERFFGRDTDLTLILDRILTGRTTLLFAASGAGKTSFLNARVIPELEDRFFISYHNRWTGGTPLRLVARSISPAWSGEEGENTLIRLYSSLAFDKPYTGSLLILDQFEEVFQQHGETPSLNIFVDALAALINAASPDVRVLLSMREEFLGELGVFDNRVPDLFNNYYRLKNPNRRQARIIISRTARTAGAQPDPGLDTLVEDLVAAGKAIRPDPTVPHSYRDSVPPPFLQIACYGLWEQSNGGATFPANYRTGQALEQLHAYCGRILKRLTRKERDRLAEALGFLITRRGAKVAWEVCTLAKHAGAPELELRTLLDKLSARDARLFRRIEAADDSVWYELYHDMYSAFMTQWKAEHLKQRARRRRNMLFTAAPILAAVLGTAWLLTTARATRQLEAAVAELRGKPDEEYRLRFGRHTDRVLDAAFSPDGARIATASFDGSAKLWDPATALAVDTLPRTAGLHVAAFHPARNQSLLAVGGADQQVRLYDWRRAAFVRTFQFGKTVYSLAFDRAGRRLACGGDGQLLKVWSLEGQPPLLLQWPNAINAMAYTPDGQELIVGDFAGRVAALSATGTASQAPAHELSVLAIAVSPDGTHIASGGRDRRIHLIDRASRRLTAALEGHTAAVRNLAFSPDGKLLASAGVDGTVRLWDVQRRAEVATLLGHIGAVYAAVFDPSGTRLVSSGQDLSVRMWDVPSRRQVVELEGEWYPPQTAQFSGDLSRVVTEGAYGLTNVWSGGRPVEGLERLTATAVGMTRDGSAIALADPDGAVRLGEGTLRPFSTALRALVFSGNGDVLAAQAADNHRVRAMDLRPDDRGRTRDTQHVLSEEPAWFLALDETGRSLAMAGRHNVSVFNRFEPQSAPRRLKRAESILRIAYNVHGQLMILYEDGSVESLDVASGRVAAGRKVRLSLPAKAVRAASSEDGRSFAFATEKGEIHLLLERATEPPRISVPQPLLALAFSRDGARLGTLDRTGTVRIYGLRRDGGFSRRSTF